MTYHDLHITTENIPRTSIFDLPYGLLVECTRQTGWQLVMTNIDTMKKEVIAGEFNENWMVLDVKGQVIINSKLKEKKGG